MSDENIYSAPKADLNEGLVTESGVRFFPTSQKKLLVLYFATLGMYPIYWFYKNWKLQKESYGENVIPPLRSIFYIFFTHSLFGKVEQAAQAKGLDKTIDAGMLATIFVSLTVISNILERVTRDSEVIAMLDYVSIILLCVIVWPLSKIQGLANKVNEDPEGKLNSSFSFYNFIFILLGIPVWLLIFVGIFQLDMSFLAGAME